MIDDTPISLRQDVLYILSYNIEVCETLLAGRIEISRDEPDTS